MARPTDKQVKKLFAKTAEPKPKYDKAELERRKTLAALSSLLSNPDFKYWFYQTLDNMYGFLADTRELTPFGQGIRAAVGKMEESLLAAPEGVGFLTDIHKRYFSAKHEALREANKQKEEDIGK